MRTLFFFVATVTFGFFAGTSFGADLRPFETDGCTKWRDGTRKNPDQWRHCCVQHDLRFWGGGLRPSRDDADRELRDCVAATGAVRESKIIYAGVRIGSRSPRKIPGMQWGNAWSPTETRKTPLSDAEIEILGHELSDPRYDPVMSFQERRAYIESLK